MKSYWILNIRGQQDYFLCQHKLATLLRQVSIGMKAVRRV